MTQRRDLLLHLKTEEIKGHGVTVRDKVTVADNSTYEVQGKGDVQISMPSGRHKLLNYAWYVADLTKNLLSVKEITK